MAGLLKRTKSVTDFFRGPTRSPSRSPSPLPTAAGPPPGPRPPDPPRHDRPPPSDTLHPPRADSYSARDRDGTSHAAPTLDTSFTRSQTVDDILGAYGDSPTKTRFAPEPQRFDSSYTTTTTASGSSSRDEMAGMPVLDHRNERNELRQSTRSSSTRNRPVGASRTKSSSELDVIDRLDISGLYGGGSFVRHDGPYAAASTTRNQGSLAPIAAFDPSAFTLTPSPASSSASSMRRAHSSGLPASSGLARSEGPYGAASKAVAGGSSSSSGARGAGGPRRDISLGYPSQREERGKGQQLLEIYGVQDNEAWEDYGQASYDSKAASRESVVPPGAEGRSKEERFARTQSIWDIEATLKAGKPVGQAPPPVPVMPSAYTAPELSPSNKPKRSKSIAARFRAGRKNPNSPMGDDLTVQVDDGREAGQAGSAPTSPTDDRPRGRDWPLTASMPASASGALAQSQSGSRRGSEAAERGAPLEIRTQALRFEDPPAPRSPVDRQGGLGRTWTDEGAGGSPTTSKKEKGGLKRLFSTKRKS
ncbi:hypothetical protein JCM9279_003209 [Rhodotorula babjevae]